MGAVIAMDGMKANRKEMFDIFRVPALRCHQAADLVGAGSCYRRIVGAASRSITCTIL